MLFKTILLLLIFATLRITVGLIWNTEQVSYTCCQGNNQLLMWSYTEETNEKIMDLQWFFNETTLICVDSKTIGFRVEAFYTGRIERNGKAGILLKNISFNDTGKYSLYVKLEEEKIRHIQDIFLTVDEGVPHQCKPTIEMYNRTVQYCSTTCLKRAHLTAVWRSKDTWDQMGNGPYLRIDADKADHAVCCLTGLECQEGEKKMSCLPIYFPSNILTEYAPNERQIETNMKDADHQTTEVQIILYIGLPVIFLFAILFAILGPTVYVLWRKQRPDLVKPTAAYTQTECKDIFQEGHLPNRPNSNQNIQIVNSIRVDRDFIKVIMTAAAREEDRELKLQTPSYKYEEKLNTSNTDKSTEMTELLEHSPS